MTRLKSGTWNENERDAPVSPSMNYAPRVSSGSLLFLRSSLRTRDKSADVIIENLSAPR